MADKKRKTKNRSKLVILIIILFLILAEGLLLYYDHVADDSSVLGSTEDSITNTTDSYLEVALNSVPVLNDTFGGYLPSNDVNISEIQLERRLIGEDDTGRVTVEGPYGNPNSQVRVAYILGQHPRESNAHDALYEALLKSSDSLNYSYYVYWINVTGESDDFEQSRMNGQLLALNIATPHIINESYDLVVDIHASNGGYVQDPYIFAPVDNDTVANQSANNLTKVLTDLIYYEPASYSSPQYSTIPIEEGGTPAVVFELRGSPDYSLEKQASEFVRGVDGLLLN